VIDNYSAAAALIPDIEAPGDGRVEVLKTNASDLARACSAFLKHVNEGSLRHQGSAALAVSVLSGRKRDLSDGWAWDRKDGSSDITQLMAVTLALHGLVAKGRPLKSKYETSDLVVV
jgi:hypothetical protein